MRFSCGKTWEQKAKEAKALAIELREWHRVFLFRPSTTEVVDGIKICSWLIWAERRYPNAEDWGTMVMRGTPEYRVVQK